MSVDLLIRRNLEIARERISAAAQRAGRSASEVTLVAVTKYADPSAAQVLLDAGCHDLAESRPQELWRKAEKVSRDGVRWHLIGNLQTNKLRRTLPLVSLLHSVDSSRLLDEIDRTAATLGLRVPLLLEVKIAQDETKHGLTPDELPVVLEHCAALNHVEVRGLMGMASREGDLASAQREFAALRELRDRTISNVPEGHGLRELSMGMSGDFEVAIAEGATMVRIGSMLFEEAGA